MNENKCALCDVKFASKDLTLSCCSCAITLHNVTFTLFQFSFVIGLFKIILYCV